MPRPTVSGSDEEGIDAFGMRAYPRAKRMTRGRPHARRPGPDRRPHVPTRDPVRSLSAVIDMQCE